MRIVCRPEFLTMPAGTIYHKYHPQYIGNLQVKVSDETDSFDWVAVEPGMPDWQDSEQLGMRLSQMEKDPTVSYPLDVSAGRDGEFAKDQLFMVYEDADKLALAELLGLEDVFPDTSTPPSLRC